MFGGLGLYVDCCLVDSFNDDWYWSFFVKNVPAKINFICGYRTKMSMKNKDTREIV